MAAPPFITTPVGGGAGRCHAHKGRGHGGATPPARPRPRHPNAHPSPCPLLLAAGMGEHRAALTPEPPPESKTKGNLFEEAGKLPSCFSTSYGSRSPQSTPHQEQDLESKHIDTAPWARRLLRCRIIHTTQLIY